jgi:hypothetical protein
MSNTRFAPSCHRHKLTQSNTQHAIIRSVVSQDKNSLTVHTQALQTQMSNTRHFKLKHTTLCTNCARTTHAHSSTNSRTVELLWPSVVISLQFTKTCVPHASCRQRTAHSLMSVPAMISALLACQRRPEPRFDMTLHNITRHYTTVPP